MVNPWNISLIIHGCGYKNVEELLVWLNHKIGFANQFLTMHTYSPVTLAPLVMLTYDLPYHEICDKSKVFLLVEAICCLGLQSPSYGNPGICSIVLNTWNIMKTWNQSLLILSSGMVNFSDWYIRYLFVARSGFPSLSLESWQSPKLTTAISSGSHYALCIHNSLASYLLYSACAVTYSSHFTLHACILFHIPSSIPAILYHLLSTAGCDLKAKQKNHST